jgi:hypothetical protein
MVPVPAEEAVLEVILVLVLVLGLAEVVLRSAVRSKASMESKSSSS